MNNADIATTLNVFLVSFVSAMDGSNGVDRLNETNQYARSFGWKPNL